MSMTRYITDSLGLLALMGTIYGVVEVIGLMVTP